MKKVNIEQLPIACNFFKFTYIDINFILISYHVEAYYTLDAVQYFYYTLARTFSIQTCGAELVYNKDSDFILL